MSQNDTVIRHLKSGKTLTPIQAIEQYKIYRLASRINDLRDLAYRIDTEMIKTKGGARVARYRLRRKK